MLGKDDQAVKGAVDSYSFEQDFVQEKIADHGHGERTGSSFGAFFNIVCVVAGTGTLQLPWCLAEGGWVALSCVFLAAAMAIFTGRLLIQCLYHKEGQRLSSYPEVGMAAYGPIAKYFIVVLHYAISLGAPCVYISLSGGGTYDLVKDMVGITKAMWIIIAAILVCIPFVLIKSMKDVAILSLFGVLATAVVVVVVVAVGFIDLPNVETTHSLVRWDNLPAAMGTICFSFGGNVVYPHVESSMKNPQSWTKVLFLAIMCSMTMYLMTAISGYFVYGEKVEAIVYDSLPPNPATITAIALLIGSIILSAPIMLTAVALELEDKFNITVENLGAAREFMFRALLRTGMVVLLTFPAVFVPVSKLMSLIGSFSNSLLIFVMPILFHWRLFGFRSMNIVSRCICLLCIVVGVVACIFGTKRAIGDLIVVFSNSG
ncbi:hypothetical protein IWQ62_005086 [Dispira parvispora]|uniref:Amino acid transporter transmembrane domain-containing protein n=1 Tax=Dispira parvispora TaxID=1520584 RepID=A0A9W8AKE5_9FUNG|nr:hypothetical protein IWQ62_005086 [Dispira parvispora]